MFVFHKESRDQISPPEYYKIDAHSQQDAAVQVLRVNKCIDGNAYLLKFVKKRFTAILDAIPSTDPAFYKLEEQNNLAPFEATWWEDAEIKVSLQEIFDLGVEYHVIDPSRALKAVLRPTDMWEFRLFQMNLIDTMI